MLKILFKPIKWILGIILGLVIMIAIPIALLYKSATPPTLSGNELEFETYIKEELDHLIDSTNDDKTLNLALDEDLINGMIHKELVKQFSETDDSNYLYKDENVMFQGAWVELKEDTINIIIGAHADARLFTFKTRVLISFKIIENEENPAELTLKLDKFRVGNLSFRWVLRFAPKLAENFLGQDIESFIEEAIGDFGTYDSNKMELTVDFYKLTDQLEENKDLAVLLLDLIYNNELLDLGVIKEEDAYKLGLSLNLNKLEDKTPNFVLAEADRIETEEEFNNFLYNKALSGIISSNDAIKFNSFEMNKIIDYIFSQSAEITNDYLMKSEIYEDYEIVVGKPYVDINNSVVINVPVEMGKDGNYFKTKFKLGITLDNNNNDDLIIEFNSANIGDVTIDEDAISQILAVAGQDNITNNKMVVEDFFLAFKDANIEITNIEVSNNMLLFNYEGFNVNDILNNIQTVINNPDLNDKVDEIIDKIGNEEEITIEDLEDLMEILEDLTDQEKENIQNIINNFLNP